LQGKTNKSCTFANMSVFFRIGGGLVVILALFASCVSTQNVVKQTEMAELAFRSGDCATALALYEKLVAGCEQSKTMSSCPAYEKAGWSASCLGDLALSESYFKLAVYHNTASPSVYSELASRYRHEGNVSKELMMLEPLDNLFPESQEALLHRARLFELSVVSEQAEMAVALWHRMDDSLRTEKMWSLYFQANSKLGRDEACNAIAQELLRINDKNVVALDWEARRYYQLAEDRYNREMKAYEANKTHKQYARLTKELEKATDDMKIALGYFKRLFSIEPGPEYALYLHNIYARFGDEKQTEYYRQRMKN